MIVDGDAHIVEPTTLWRDFVPSAWHDRIQVQRSPDGHMQGLLFDNEAVFLASNEGNGLEAGFSYGDGMNPGGFRTWPPRNRQFEEADPGGWDPQRRLRLHDQEGIDAAVLFPSIALAFGHLPCDTNVLAVACEAVNRWISAFCSVAPDEFHPVAILPAGDPSLAVKELRRAVKDGHVAGLIRPNPHPNGRMIDDPAYDILWSAAEELDVPMCIHNLADGTGLSNAGVDRSSKFFLRHAAAHPFEAMLAFGAMFKARVFERHPRLRAGYMEAACGWLPFWLERLDEHTEVVAGQFDPPLERLPSEVFREQCVVGCEGDEKMVPYVQEQHGLRSVVWASDFPHFDSEFPLAERILERKDLNEQQRNAVLCDAALHFYKLDQDAIARSNARRRTARPSPTLAGERPAPQ
jgi:predicted TIM-barrel fold metal-dependent hydrolase